MNLSEKIGWANGIPTLAFEDVKEFIKRLKEIVFQPLSDKTRLELIKKLAGEKLI